MHDDIDLGGAQHGHLDRFHEGKVPDPAVMIGQGKEEGIVSDPAGFHIGFHLVVGIDGIADHVDLFRPEEGQDQGCRHHKGEEKGQDKVSGGQKGNLLLLSLRVRVSSEGPAACRPGGGYRFRSQRIQKDEVL